MKFEFKSFLETFDFQEFYRTMNMCNGTPSAMLAHLEFMEKSERGN